jgi:hypothetical protein
VGKKKDIDFSSNRPPFLKRIKDSSSSLRGTEEQCLGLFKVLVLGLLVDSHLLKEALPEGHQD